MPEKQHDFGPVPVPGERWVNPTSGETVMVVATSVRYQGGEDGTGRMAALEFTRKYVPEDFDSEQTAKGVTWAPELAQRILRTLLRDNLACTKPKWPSWLVIAVRQIADLTPSRKSVEQPEVPRA